MGDGVEEFLNNIASVLSVRKEPTVLAIVHSEMGLEFLSNSSDLVMKLGMLDVARLTVLEVQASLMKGREEEARRAGERAVAALAVKPGRTN